QDGVHLEHREMLPEAPLASSAPRQPHLRVRQCPEEALRPEHLRLGAELRVVLYQVDATDKLGRALVGGSRDLEWPLHYAWDREEKHGPVAQNLLNRRGQIAFAAPVERAGELC